MRTKTFAVLLFAVIFISGIFFINAKMPKDKIGLTAPYSEKTDVYVPPDAKLVEKFDAGGMAMTTVGMAGFTQLASSSGSQNFMSSSVVKGSG